MFLCAAAALIFDIKAHADTSLYCSFMPAKVSVLVAISKILLSETLRLMQHAAMPSSFNLSYGQASVVVMSQKTLFEIALALAMKMTVQVMSRR